MINKIEADKEKKADEREEKTLVTVDLRGENDWALQRRKKRGTLQNPRVNHSL